MDSQMANRIELIWNAESFLQLLVELEEEECLLYEIESTLKEKMKMFDISPLFNFPLWKKLKDVKHLFNYLYISKKMELKQKWLMAIKERIPEVWNVYQETHQVFDYFKKVLDSLKV